MGLLTNSDGDVDSTEPEGPAIGVAGAMMYCCVVTPGEFGCSTNHCGLGDAQDDCIWGSLSQKWVQLRRR